MVLKTEEEDEDTAQYIQQMRLVYHLHMDIEGYDHDYTDRQVCLLRDTMLMSVS